MTDLVVCPKCGSEKDFEDGKYVIYECETNVWKEPYSIQTIGYRCLENQLQHVKAALNFTLAQKGKE